MQVGLVGFGTWLPPGRMTAADLAAATGIPENVIALKFGVKGKPVAGPGETTAFMGLAAARKALASAGIDGAAVDLVIWCGAQHKDYPCWLAGLYVADKIGAKKAWSFDMEAMCGSMMAALDVAKSLMLTHPGLDTVLLVSGYRNNDLIDLSVPATRFMLDIGSAGSAVVLKKGARKNAVLASAFRGDGSLSEMCVVPALGARAWPPAADDVARAHFVVPDEEAFKKKLNEVTMPNFYAVIREALTLSGLPENGIDYLAILHFKKSAHDAVLAELGLSPAQSTYLDEYGHLARTTRFSPSSSASRAGRSRRGRASSSWARVSASSGQPPS